MEHSIPILFNNNNIIKDAGDETDMMLMKMEADLSSEGREESPTDGGGGVSGDDLDGSDVELENATKRMKSSTTAAAAASATAAAAATTGNGDSVSKQRTANDGLGTFKCQQCDKAFNRVCYLTQHNNTFHKGDKPFKCHMCGKRFQNAELFGQHQQKHAGDKPYKCPLCPKQFNHKTDLRRHMCLHTGQKPFMCQVCSKGFIRKDHMVKHVQTHTRRNALHASAQHAPPTASSI